MLKFHTKDKEVILKDNTVDLNLRIGKYEEDQVYYIVYYPFIDEEYNFETLISYGSKTWVHFKVGEIW